MNFFVWKQKFRGCFRILNRKTRVRNLYAIMRILYTSTVYKYCRTSIANSMRIIAYKFRTLRKKPSKLNKICIKEGGLTPKTPPGYASTGPYTPNPGHDNRINLQCVPRIPRFSKNIKPQTSSTLLNYPTTNNTAFNFHSTCTASCSLVSNPLYCQFYLLTIRGTSLHGYLAVQNNLHKIESFFPSFYSQ